MPKGSAGGGGAARRGGGGPKESARAAKQDIKAGRAPAGKPAPTAKEKPVGAKGRAGAARQEIKAGRANSNKSAPTNSARQATKRSVPAGSTALNAVPRNSAPTGPVGPDRPVPLPQGIQAKRPAGRGRTVGRVPTTAPLPSVPGYDPMSARPTMGSPLSDMGFGNRPM